MHALLSLSFSPLFSLLAFRYCHKLVVGCWVFTAAKKKLWILNLHVGDAGRVGLDDVVGEIDEKLGEAPLCGSVVTEDRGEGGVAKRLG